MLNKILVSCVIRDVNGNVDANATKEKYELTLLTSNVSKLAALDAKLAKDMSDAMSCFDQELKQYTSERGDWDNRSHHAVMAMFEKYSKVNRSGKIIKGNLVSLAANFLLNARQIGMNEIKKAETMIANYIDDNSGPIDSGALFNISSGKDGGCSLNNRKANADIRA